MKITNIVTIILVAVLFFVIGYETGKTIMFERATKIVHKMPYPSDKECFDENGVVVHQAFYKQGILHSKLYILLKLGEAKFSKF